MLTAELAVKNVDKIGPGKNMSGKSRISQSQITRAQDHLFQWDATLYFFSLGENWSQPTTRKSPSTETN